MQELIDQIRAHLKAHPGARDDLNEIVQWWLSSSLRSVSPVELKSALARLVQQGEIREMKQGNGVTVYEGSFGKPPKV